MGGEVRETVLELHYDAHMPVSQIARAALVSEMFARDVITADWDDRAVAYDRLVRGLRESRLAREMAIGPIIERKGGSVRVDELAGELGVERDDVLELCRNGLLDASKNGSKWVIEGANAGGGDD